jgi:carboxylate-amine ligase
MEFVPQQDPTLGCEWELQLLRQDSFELADGILAIIGHLDDHALIKKEFLQCCVELNTPPCDSASEIEKHLERVRRLVDRQARSLNVRLAGAGTHPFDRKPAIVTPSERYLRLTDERAGAAAIHPVTFATHLHVACADGDAAIRAMRRITPCLPGLLAIGANSPFWHGVDTGYTCSRQRLLASNPTYGLPPYFESWEDYNRMLAAAVRSGTVDSFRDLHWDIRPHGDLGTLEIRVLDAQLDAHRIAQIAALVRALVVVAAERRTGNAAFPARLPHWMELENHFRASKSGLDADLISTTAGDTHPMSRLVERIFEISQRTAERLGDGTLLSELEESLVSVNGSRLQRVVWQRRHSSRDVADFLTEVLEDASSVSEAAKTALKADIVRPAIT